MCDFKPGDIVAICPDPDFSLGGFDLWWNFKAEVMDGQATNVPQPGSHYRTLALKPLEPRRDLSYPCFSWFLWNIKDLVLFGSEEHKERVLAWELTH